MLFGFRIWIATIISGYLDKTLVSLNESLKAFLQELWELGAQVANFTTLAILGFFYRPGYLSYIEQRNRIKKRSPLKNINNNNINSNGEYNSKPSPSSGLRRRSSSTIDMVKKRRQTPFVQLLNEDSNSNFLNNNNNSNDGSNNNGGNNITSSPKKVMRHSSSTSTIRRISSTDLLQQQQESVINRKNNNLNNSGNIGYTTTEGGLLKKKKKKRLYYINRDLVHHHEQITTGFIEDLRTNIMLLVDRIFHWLRTTISSLLSTIASFKIRKLLIFIITLPFFLPLYLFKTILLPCKIVKIIFNVVINRLKKVKEIPNRLISDKELDVRSVKEIIEQAGYPYERYHVTTEDGYILLLERIPNHKSKQILYLQHGVFDNSFAWVANGPTQSLAFQAHDQGYDVFLGNLRGNGERLHTENNISSKQYWDFSINEHAFLDIPSFIQVIRQVKIKELSNNNNDIVQPEDINISAVAHSMGAACILMYIVMMGLLKKSHHLSRAILLSPAGYHETAPKICDILGPIISAWLWVFPMHVFRFPSEKLRVISAKIYHDVMSNTPTKDLMVYFGSRFLLGGDMKDHPLEKIHNLAYNTFCGTSVKIYKHFWQIRKSRKFQAYDYGSKQKNIDVYGTPYPLNFLDHYDVINIPVHFIMGLKDNLIEPVNIIKHYTTLKKHHPQNAYLKASKSGHIEFTLGLDDQILSYILKILGTNNNNNNNNNNGSSSSNNNSPITTSLSSK